jgi:hypothetical protein
MRLRVALKFASFSAFAALLGASWAGCSSAAAVGEECSTPGAEDECDEKGICDKKEDGTIACLKRCTDQDDCGTEESCNGITGSEIKACHPKAK